MSNTEIVARVVTSPFEAARGSLYAILIEAGAARDLGDYLVRGLVDVDEATWRRELVKEHNLASLAVDLVAAGFRIRLGSAFVDAIVDHANRTVRGEVAPALLKPAHWRSILACLPNESRLVMRRNLLDAAISGRETIPDAFLEYYGEEIADAEVLSDPRAISQLFTSLIKARNVRGMQWMVEFLRRESDFADKGADRSAMADLRLRVRDLIGVTPEEDGDKFGSVLVQLATVLGLEPHLERRTDNDDES